MSVQIITYPDRDTQARRLAALVADELASSLAADGQASAALSGGTTPVAFLDALSGADLAWDRITVFPSDERWVPPEHPRSNGGMLRHHLLKGRAAAARIVDFWTGDTSPEAGLAGATARLSPYLPPAVLVVGMGNDLHVAGLFPGAPDIARALASDAPPVVTMQGAPVHPGEAAEPRISLSLPALKAARHRHLLLTGAEKQATLERALALPPEADPRAAPIIALLPSLTVHWAP